MGVTETVSPDRRGLTMRVINLTPHAVTVIPESEEPITFPASGSVARVREASGTPAWLHTANGTVPLSVVSYVDRVDDLPDPEPGVIYLVSRVTAAAVDRPDLVFPQGELRDERGTIIGCRALGTFHANTGAGAQNA